MVVDDEVPVGGADSYGHWHSSAQAMQLKSRALVMSQSGNLPECHEPGAALEVMR